MRLASILLLTVFFTPPASLSQGWEWQNPLPHGQTVNDIAILSPISAIAACDNGYFMTTATEGRTWQTRRLGRVNIERVLTAGDGSLIAVTDRRRIYRSTDDAYSFTQVYQGDENSTGQRSDMVRVDDSTLVGFLNGAHVVISTDYGQSWRHFDNVNLLSENVRSISAQSPTTWYVVTSRNLLRTTDRGVGWHYANEEYQVRGLQRFAFIDSTYGYQLREGQLLRTRDGGANWTEMDIFGFGVVWDLAAGPHMGSDVYCMSIGRYLINKSTDAGESWNISLTETAFPDAQPLTMAFFNKRTGMIGGDGGRILRTSDGGQSWSIVHGIGYIGTIADLLFRDANTGVATTYTPTLLISSNGGNRWDEVIPSPDHSPRMLAVSPSGTFHAIAGDAGNDFDLLASTDDGLTWEKRGRIPFSYSINRPEMPQSLYALSENELWAGGTFSLLMHSTDGGRSWERKMLENAMTSPFSTGMEIFFFPPDTILYIRSNAVMYSSDGGENWTTRPTMSGRSIRSAEFLTPEIGYALLPTEFASTSDGGVTWDISREFTPSLLHFFDETDGVVLWSNSDEDDLAYLMRTTDGGQNWERYPTNERVNWSNWFWLARDVGWAYGYDGTIRRTDNGGIAFASGRPALPSASLELAAGYPNPYRGGGSGVTVPFRLATAQSVTLSLHDLHGRRLTSLELGPHSAGAHSALLPSSLMRGLRPGVYVYRISAGDMYRMGRVMVMGRQ